MVDPIEAARRIILQNDRERQEPELLRSRAQELGRELAGNILTAHPEVVKVWGFGSAFETWRYFRRTNDVDLAVEKGDIMALLPLVEGRESF